MDAVLLDTDVFSYLLKNDARADPYRPHVRGQTVAVSFVTVGELFAGAEKKGWGTAKREQLESKLRAVSMLAGVSPRTASGVLLSGGGRAAG